MGQCKASNSRIYHPQASGEGGIATETWEVKEEYQQTMQRCFLRGSGLQSKAQLANGNLARRELGNKYSDLTLPTLRCPFQTDWKCMGEEAI